MRVKTITSSTALSLIVLGAPVYADPAGTEATSGSSEEATPAMYSYAWSEPKMSSQIGIGMTVGGGLAGFTNKTLRDTVDTNVSGMWTARASFGTHIPIGIEAAYVGTDVALNRVNGIKLGNLVGTEFEADVRWNILPHYEWNPYVFGGLGYQRYDITNSKLAQADTSLSSKDNLLAIPFGAGVSYRDRSGFTFDVRGTFRPTTGADLVKEPGGGQAQEHTWDTTAQLGYEF